MKTCSKCEEKKELEAFAVAKKNRDGRQNHCKECNRRYREGNKERIRSYQQRYREDNSDERSRYQREYYQKNRDSLMEYQVGYRDQNREKLIEQRRAYRERNPDKVRESHRRSRTKHADRIRLRKKKYHEENRESVNARTRRYCRENLEVFAAKNQRRRARKRGLPNENFHPSEIFERDGWVCYLCKDAVPRFVITGNHPDGPTLDHVVPISYDGPDNPGHVRSNVRLTHRVCNLKKGTTILDSSFTLG